MLRDNMIDSTGNAVLLVDNDLSRCSITVDFLSKSQLFSNIISLQTLEEALFIVKKDIDEREVNVNLIVISLELDNSTKFDLSQQLKQLCAEYNKDLIIAGLVEEDENSDFKRNITPHIYKAPIKMDNLQAIHSMLQP